MLLRGRKITALEAHQIGLITQVFLPENLMGGVIARVENLAQQSAKVHLVNYASCGDGNGLGVREDLSSVFF